MKKAGALLAVFLLLLTGCSGEDGGAQDKSAAALSNTIGWGYGPRVDGRPSFTKEQMRDMEENACIYMGADNKNLYLTFDEGYENGYTAKILDTLKEKNVPAAFFITGPYLKTETDLVRRMVEEGHVVGNHTVNHPSLPSLTDDEKIKAELSGLDGSFSAQFGKRMTFFRPPKGEYNARTLKITRDMGYTNVFWSFAYEDWDVKKQKGAAYAHDKVMEGLHGGAVILLHAVSPDNAEALASIIDDARQMGYTFCSLEEYVPAKKE